MLITIAPEPNADPECEFVGTWAAVADQCLRLEMDFDSSTSKASILIRPGPLFGYAAKVRCKPTVGINSV